MFQRLINLPKRHSFFLFGARGTGKTSLLQHSYTRDTHFIDLLNLDLEAAYLERPERLNEELESLPRIIRRIVIDEIQKAPKLLDVVHRQIEKGRFTFILTGSSARKLRRGASNLLAGRAFVLNLFPLLKAELRDRFDLQEVLEYGALPKIFSLDHADKKRYLRAYAQSYVREEVWNEQFIRNLAPFSKFLEVAAQSHGQIVNYSKIAREINVDHKTVENYFSILEDTLLGFFLPAYEKSVRKQQRLAPKFYLFDNGVKRALDKTIDGPLLPHTYDYGIAFEHLVLREIITQMHYREIDLAPSYLRTESGAEIDLILSKSGRSAILIEIKSSNNVKAAELKHLKLLKRDIKHRRAYCLCNESRPRIQDDIRILPWHFGISEILSDASKS